jgi:hypothetical protein
VGRLDLRVPLRVALRSLIAAALLAAAACSPESPSSPEAEKQEPAAERNSESVAAAPAPSAEPASRAAAPSAGQGARRCGWLSNPTPGNWWLADRDGQWILATQGGEQAPGMDDMPDMSTAGWVETNGHYGHGCACMTIAHDPATRRVTRVANAEPKPLDQCRADKSLPGPE